MIADAEDFVQLSYISYPYPIFEDPVASIFRFSIPRTWQQVHPEGPDDPPQRAVPLGQPGGVQPHRGARHQGGHNAKDILRGRRVCERAARGRQPGDPGLVLRQAPE